MVDDKPYWIAFNVFEGIGPLRFKLLLEYFGSAKKAWEAKDRQWRKIGLGAKLTAKFVDFRNNFSLDQYLRELKKKDIRVVTLKDKEYPQLLKEIPTAPFVLYIRGNFDMLQSKVKPCIGVVGTRKITFYGREVTRRLVEGLVDAGLTIVSGMAYGVDTVAHETAIEAGGKTIAVLGCGVDIIYPKSNTTLYWRIVKKAGLLMSEFPLGRSAQRSFFPARNRIISGLSLGVVVTQGAKKSGALITARYAAEQGREVFAVPGPITSAFSKAPAYLLKKGAKLVTEVEDILEELKIEDQSASRRIKIKNIHSASLGQANKKSNILLTKDEKAIVELLKGENLHFDEIVRKSKIQISKLASLLTMMEMKGLVKNLGSGVYGCS